MAHGPPEASVPRQVETKTGERSTTRSPQQGKETGGESGVLGAHLQTPSGHQGAQGLVIQIETAADVPGGLGALGHHGSHEVQAGPSHPVQDNGEMRPTGASGYAEPPAGRLWSAVPKSEEGGKERSEQRFYKTLTETSSKETNPESEEDPRIKDASYKDGHSPVQSVVLFAGQPCPTLPWWGTEGVPMAAFPCPGPNPAVGPALPTPWALCRVLGRQSRPQPPARCVPAESGRQSAGRWGRDVDPELCTHTHECVSSWAG